MRTLKITVLGSCSGTEPYPCRHQTSVAIETGGQVYFIDAGENAGYASYLGGVPQQDTAAIFITHSPCIHCALLIQKCGITDVYYHTLYRSNEGLEFLKRAGVNVTHLDVEPPFPMQPCDCRIEGYDCGGTGSVH